MRQLTIATTLLATAWLATLTTSANAQATMDGSIVGDEAFYGAALSTQNTRTEFGDASNSDSILSGGGSEIDQVFATVSGDRLYVLITGNLEGGNLGGGDNNFNKLNVFIDSVAGGVNTLDGDNLPGAMDGFCCGGFEPPLGDNTDGVGALQRMSGTTFDSNFNADYHLIFTHGGESVTSGTAGSTDFWAITSHFADLTNMASGAVGGLGMQLAPRGEPRVLRSPALGAGDGDYNDDGVVDAIDYAVWRENLGTSNPLPNDPTGGTIGTTQYDTWKLNFGNTGAPGGNLDEVAFKPGVGNPTESLLSDFTLAGLGQGELIDRNYALGAGDCDDDSGDGCLARELAFALEVAEDERGLADPTMNNSSNHRNLNNVVDLRMAFDNSNTGGVFGPVDGEFEVGEDGTAGIDDPTEVETGIEFSIPLDQIGTPTGDIKLTVAINGGSHDFFSNQFSGDGNQGDDGNGLGRGNLGTALFDDGPDPPLFTLVDLPGDQFVTVTQLPPVGLATPEPASLLLVACGSLLALVRRRR